MTTARTIVLCGRTGSGKSTGGRFLAATLGVAHVEASAIMRGFWEAEGASGRLEAFALRTLAEAPERVPRAVLATALDNPVVLTGFRAPGELTTLLRARPDAMALFVEAAPEVRLGRILGRARPGDPRSLPELLALDALHEAMGIADIRRHSELVVVANDRSLAEFEDALRAVVGA